MVSSKISSSREHGGVILECALIIPLVVVIFTGLTELGRTFAQINWVANISYEVAMVGASVSKSTGGELAMDGRYTQLNNIPYYQADLPEVADSKVYNLTDNEVDGQPARSVQVSIHATLPILLSHVSPTFDVRATAPILVLENLLPEDLGVFKNPEGGVLYDCCGHEDPGGADSCVPMPPCE